MKLLLRPDVYRASTSDGLAFLTPHGPVSFRGASIARWLDRIEPYLDGRFDIDELTGNLGPAHREMLHDVVGALLESGVLREVPGAEDEPAGADERYLRYFRTGTAAALRHYRDSPALVLGPPELAAAVADSCSRSGLQRVHQAHSDDRLDELVAGARIVLRLASGPDLALARRLGELTAGTERVLGHAVLLGDRALLGPVGSTSRCWESAWRRLLAISPRDGRTDGEFGAAELTVVANQLVHRAFRVVTGLADDAERDELTSVRADTMASTRHAFLAHPYSCPPTRWTAAEFAGKIAELSDGAELPEETVSTRSAALVDERTGVFAEITQRGFTQFPLYVTEAVVSDPAGLLGSGECVSVLGAGPDFASARHRAALRGYAAYGALAPDPRRFIGCAPDDDPDDLLNALRAGRSAYTWGYRLVDGKVCRVAAQRAFPALHGLHTPRAELPVAGSAAGYTWRQAVETGLLAHVRAEALAALPGEATPLPTVELTAAALDGTGLRYLAMLRDIGQPLEVYDLTRLLGVPCHLFRLDGTTVGCGCGASAREALRDGMEQALLHYQSRCAGEPEYAPPPVPEPAPALRGTTPQAPPTTRLGLDALVAALRRAGHEPVAVPLDHDPEVAARMPYVVQVVLGHD